MKRNYTEMASNLSTLPKTITGDHQPVFKGVLTGTHKLWVTKVVDISKPAHKPVDDVDEPEEDEVAAQNRLNKSNARMIQLDLKDSDNKVIRAIETERMESLTSVEPDNIITIEGPVDVRCGNILLEKKNLISIDSAPQAERIPTKEVKQEEPVVIEIGDDEPFSQENDPSPSSSKPVPCVEFEDWDEDDEEDCIVLN